MKDTHKIIKEKICELKKYLKESTGKCFEVYNRDIFMKKSTNKLNWDDILCRQIVVLNSLDKKLKKNK